MTMTYCGEIIGSYGIPNLGHSRAISGFHLRSLRQGIGQGLRESFISEVLQPGPKRLAVLGKEPPQDLDESYTSAELQ